MAETQHISQPMITETILIKWLLTTKRKITFILTQLSKLQESSNTNLVIININIKTNSPKTLYNTQEQTISNHKQKIS